MEMRRAFRLALALPLAGCSDDNRLITAPPQPGFLVVTNTTTGSAFDLDGFEVVVDGIHRTPMDVNGATTQIRLPAGPHEVELIGLAGNCSPSGPAQQTVAVSSGPTTGLRFLASCEAPPELASIRVLFTHEDKAGSRLVAMNADGSARLQLTQGPGDRAPAISPDGMKIAFIRAIRGVPTLHVMRSDGREIQRLADQARDPAWSPDGRSIAFAGEGGSWGGPIMVVPAGGGAAHPLTGPEPSPEDGNPHWSPDGTRVYFTRAERLTRWPLQVWSVRPDGTDARPLEVQPFGDAPIWSPDGRRIATTYNDFDGTGVYLTGEGTHLEVFYAWYSLWTVTDWSDDGSMLLLAGSGWIRQFETSDDLYLYTLADKSLVRLTAGDTNSAGSLLAVEARVRSRGNYWMKVSRKRAREAWRRRRSAFSLI